MKAIRISDVRAQELLNSYNEAIHIGSYACGKRVNLSKIAQDAIVSSRLHEEQYEEILHYLIARYSKYVRLFNDYVEYQIWTNGDMKLYYISIDGIEFIAAAYMGFINVYRLVKEAQPLHSDDSQSSQDEIQELPETPKVIYLADDSQSSQAEVSKPSDLVKMLNQKGTHCLGTFKEDCSDDILVIYIDVALDGKITAGELTNLGMVPRVSVEYDRRKTVDSNLENVMNALEDSNLTIY